MSGIEIAGLVLGGFPLLVSAAEHYKEGWEPLVKWKRFRTEFLHFIDAIDIEKHLFDQMLERFLISADITQAELQLFLTDPNYEGWQRKELAAALEMRLGHSYGAFMSSIRTMNQLMAELQSLLSLRDGKFGWADEGASSWDYQLKRIRHSFSKKGTKAVEALERHNRKLRELLDSNDKLENVKLGRKDTAWAKVFECIRDHAKSLHTAIRDGWNCDCREPHEVALRLQPRSIGDWSSSFNISFKYPEILKAEDFRAPEQRRELVIKLKLPNTQSNQQPDILLHPSIAEAERDRLRRRFESKSTPEVNVTASGILTPPSPSLSTSSQSSFRSSFSSSQSLAQNSVSTNVLIEEFDAKKWLSGLKAKAKKSVRIHAPPEIVPPAPVLLAIDINLLNLANSPAPPVISAPPSSAAIHTAEIKIQDLCEAVYKPSTTLDTYVGYLPDGQHRHEFHCLDGDASSNAIYEEDFISLATILSGHRKSVRLNRYERYKVASIIASSLLQLHDAPWLDTKLRKENIFFPCDWNENKIKVEQPYLAHSFLSTKYQKSNLESTRKANSTTNVKKSLNDLGIILLELCFGQCIEEQVIRENFLVDGKEHTNTDYLTALEWADMVQEQEPALDHVIKCCMFCIFEEKANWDNPKFTQAVYTSVVEPLEKVVSNWAKVT